MPPKQLKEFIEPLLWHFEKKDEYFFHRLRERRSVLAFPENRIRWNSESGPLRDVLRRPGEQWQPNLAQGSDSHAHVHSQKHWKQIGEWKIPSEQFGKIKLSKGDEPKLECYFKGSPINDVTQIWRFSDPLPPSVTLNWEAFITFLTKVWTPSPPTKMTSFMNDL